MYLPFMPLLVLRFLMETRLICHFKDLIFLEVLMTTELGKLTNLGLEAVVI